jgi:hypothetical protein
VLNEEWRAVKHMTVPSVLKQLKGMVKDMKDVDLQGMKADPRNEKRVKIYTTGIRRKHFVSAEGPYSSHIFSSPNNYTVLVAGRIMSDKLTKPVLWKVHIHALLSVC